MKFIQMTEQDNYEEALEQIRKLVVKLHGGYYEPRSDRDRQLGLELWGLYEKHAGDIFCTEGKE